MLFSKIKWIVVLMIFTLSLVAQSGDNPFELQNRLEKKPQPTEKSTTTSTKRSDNPFDITRHSEKKKNEIATTPIIPKIKNTSGEMDDKNFRFWMTILTLILLALFSSLYRNQLTRAFRGFGNENVTRMMQREKGTVAYVPYYVWYGFFIFNAGFYTYLLMRYFEVSFGGSNWVLFGTALGGVAILFFLKQFVVRMMGIIFPVKKEADLYNLTITMFGIVMGIVLILINLFIAYLPEHLLRTFIYISFFIISGIYLFRAIRGLSISSKFLRFHKFHFFIYLCTVEIAPVLILWKIVTISTGIQ